MQNKNKMVAPIIVTVLVVLYYIFYFCFLITMLEGILKYLLGIIPIIFSVVSVYSCTSPSTVSGGAIGISNLSGILTE